MAPVALEFGEALAKTRVSVPNVPVVQNVDATSSSDPEEIRLNLIAQLSKPVRWTQCVEAMVARGATTLVECGPGRVLGGLIKRIDRSVASFGIGSVDAFDAAIADIGRG